MSLQGKKVVVVGASGDIGTAVAWELTTQGSHVYNASSATMDVTSPGSVREFLAHAWGSGTPALDGLVLCHGAPGCIKPTTELTDVEFSKVIEVDLMGTFRVAREAARYMIARGRGSIVAVSSIHAMATYPQRAAYAAAKAGVVGLMRALAIEWAVHGISVNCVLPGQVLRTRRTNGLKERSPGIEALSPGGAFVSTGDVARAVCFLLDAPHGINGHSLVVDNGWTASAWKGQ